MEQSLIKQPKWSLIIFLSTDSSDYLPGEPKTFFQCLHILQHVQANPNTDLYLDTLWPLWTLRCFFSFTVQLCINEQSLSSWDLLSLSVMLSSHLHWIQSHEDNLMLKDTLQSCFDISLFLSICASSYECLKMNHGFDQVPMIIWQLNYLFRQRSIVCAYWW